MSGIYDSLKLCPERVNPETGEKEWLYCDSWHNEKYMDLHGPGAILDDEWSQGDEYD